MAEPAIKDREWEIAAVKAAIRYFEARIVDLNARGAAGAGSSAYAAALRRVLARMETSE